MARKHPPHPEAARFDFTQDRHLGVFVCQRVADGEPVLRVSHDAEGDWQFLCGGDHGDGNPEDPGLVWCLEHAVARDPSLNALASMGCGHAADRDSASAAWDVRDETEDFVLRCVEDPGWAVLHVTEDGEAPGFSYTVGLYARFGHPELICVGLPPELLHAMLDDCGERVRGGERLPVGAPIAGVLEGFDVRLREVRAPESFRSYPGYARWYYGRGTQGAARAPGAGRFPLLQLVWPDRNGRFPGERGAAAVLARQQPLLP